MSCFEQISLAIGEKEVLMSLSVVSSVHCCIVMSGFGAPAFSTFISHRPALRTGNSTAPALIGASRPATERDTRSSRLMGGLPLDFQLHLVARSEHTPRVAKTCPAGKPGSGGAQYSVRSGRSAAP